MANGAIFAPDGSAYVMMPRISLEGPDGERNRAAADVLQAILAWATRGQIMIEVSDDDLCAALGTLGRPKSRRFVQKGLKQLESLDLIARARLKKVKDGIERLVRQITLKYRLAQAAVRERKSKSGADVRPKKFAPPCAQTGASLAPDHALSLESSREQEKENKAGAADVRLEGRSSSPAEGPEEVPAPSPEEAAAFLRAKMAEVAAAASDWRAKGVETPAGAKAWRPKPRWERFHALPEAEKERLAATDPIIRRELEQARAAIQAADESPSVADANLP